MLELEFTDALCAPGLQRHHHPQDELILVEEGEATLLLEGRRFRGGPGTLFCISSLEPHATEVQDCRYRRGYLLLDPAFFREAVPSPILHTLFTVRSPEIPRAVALSPEDHAFCRQVFRSIECELAGTEAVSFGESAAGAWLQLLMIRLYRRIPEWFPLRDGRQDAERLSRILEALDARLDDPGFRIDDLGQMVHLSRSHLSRSFRAATGYTLQQYRSRRRMALARSLLSETSLSVSDIGFRCGYGDTSHFIRTFREACGMSPHRFRSLLAAPDGQGIRDSL